MWHSAWESAVLGHIALRCKTWQKWAMVLERIAAARHRRAVACCALSQIQARLRHGSETGSRARIGWRHRVLAKPGARAPILEIVPGQQLHAQPALACEMQLQAVLNQANAPLKAKFGAARKAGASVASKAPIGALGKAGAGTQCASAHPKSGSAQLKLRLSKSKGVKFELAYFGHSLLWWRLERR